MRAFSLGQRCSIAVCNGIDPSSCRGSEGTVTYTTTWPIHARGRWSEGWINRTDYRYIMPKASLPLSVSSGHIFWVTPREAENACRSIALEEWPLGLDGGLDRKSDARDASVIADQARMTADCND